MNSHSGDDPQHASGAGATLRAIVAVDERDRVQCQQPGCGHSVYAAVHIVQEDGRLIVLGSRCFVKRYGDANALGPAQYGGGAGRRLTDDEREMLMRNTRDLLASFEREALAAAEAQAARLEEQRRKEASPSHIDGPRPQPHIPARRVARPPSPWPWQKAWTSVALLTSPHGRDWVRVQHQDGSQKLVPWPRFDGWEASLPAGVGVPDAHLGVIAVSNIQAAIRLLQGSGFRGPFAGAWQEVLPRHAAQPAPRPHSQRQP
jgi:hypothetical protein